MITFFYQMAIILMVLVLLIYSGVYCIKFLLKINNTKYWISQDVLSNLNIIEQQLNLLKQDINYKIKMNETTNSNISAQVEEIKSKLEQVENYLEAQPDHPFRKRKRRIEVDYDK